MITFAYLTTRKQELPREDIEGCAHCLRCVLPQDRFPLSDAIYKAIYSEGVPEGVDCKHCGEEHYCSEECRKVSFHSYSHRITKQIG